jgi:CARDB protein
MRRTVFHLCLLATVLAAAAAGAAGALASGPGATRSVWPLASVKVAKCSLVDRSGVFVGRMRRVRGTEVMWMRYTLLERTGSGDYEAVHARGLGRWRKSDPGVRAFRYRQRVRGLSEGTSYRMSVRFRWYDEEGNVIRRARRRSGLCRQYTVLPNLRMVRLRAEPGSGPGTARYIARVSNRGAVAVTNATVALSLDGGELDRQTIHRLPAYGSQSLVFEGPKCAAGDEVRAVADPDGSLVESSERDNRLARACDDLLH